MTRRLSLLFILCSLSFSPAGAQSGTQILPVDTVAVEPASSGVVPMPVIIGYLSYTAALDAMPQRAAVTEQVQQLREAYEQELKRVEDEFNQKYEAFLEGMSEYPRTILLKRQRELQELLQQNVAFKTQAQADLKRAEQEALEPLRTRLSEAIADIARELHLVVVVNTDAEACPFIDTDVAVSVQQLVADKLQQPEGGD